MCLSVNHSRCARNVSTGASHGRQHSRLAMCMPSPRHSLLSFLLTSTETDPSSRDILSGVHAGATAAMRRGGDCSRRREAGLAGRASTPDPQQCFCRWRAQQSANSTQYHRDRNVGPRVVEPTGPPTQIRPHSSTRGALYYDAEHLVKLACPDRGSTAGTSEGKLVHGAKEAHERPSRRMLPCSTEGSGTWCSDK